jgi:peptidoglycan/LPS O-acetylase OafA/YrhL
MALKYRSDIDGLRAIAVLAVLFFHTDVPGFSGGFVGVDIFFVISGYLITSILLKEINSKQFSIAKFYERRIRRIFPALFPVIAFTLIVGIYLFDPNALNDLGQSVTATTLFFSNILFWLKSGYFASPSLQKPLLHTWSLSVEEQFYIFFPLTLIMIRRYLKSRFFLWIMVAFIISFILSIYELRYNQEATFYLVPTRAWELLAGSILAMGVLPNLSKSWQKNLFALTGVILIIYSIFYYTEATPFPGLAAFPPVLGSALIIYSGMGEGTYPAQKLFTARPLVFIGLISYSLYLWHWPLIVSVKYMLFKPLSGYEKVGIILMSLGIAVLSWKYIELPFRDKRILIPDRKKLFTIAAIVMIFASGVGVAIYIQNGMIWRHPEAKKIMDQCEWEWYPDGIYGKIEQSANNIKPGKIGNKTVSPSFLLWGDSHAMSLIPAFDNNAKKYRLSGFIATHSACPPIIGLQIINKPFDEVTFNRNVLAFINKHHEIHTVFLAASWESYINSNEICYPADYAGQGLYNTVKILKEMNRDVVLIGDYPLLKNYDSPRIFYLEKRFPFMYDTKIFRTSRSDYEILNAKIYHLFADINKELNAKIFRQDQIFFDTDGKTIIINQGVPLYRDNGHLSNFGSNYLAFIFNDFFKDMAKQQQSISGGDKN